MICSFAPGVIKPSAASGGVSGMGVLMPPEVRAKLAPQFIGYLCEIHTAGPI